VKGLKMRSPSSGRVGEIPSTPAMAPRLPPAAGRGPPRDTQGVCNLSGRPRRRDGVSRSHWVLYGVTSAVRELPEGVPPQGTVAGSGNPGPERLGVEGTAMTLPAHPERGPIIATLQALRPGQRPRPCHPTRQGRSPEGRSGHLLPGGADRAPTSGQVIKA